MGPAQMINSMDLLIWSTTDLRSEPQDPEHLLTKAQAVRLR